ncbi:uncharacterized protein LOC116841853 [Odontomachus brunneus]|uniref:uncharacterized protein LOC116841853 n=1 Tax=Odontomachus brunneus TaxID=486640 RepID=UPI0013F1B8BE|nr:uncharacterized protein LOC116841853 [Odontomachus brunneus]
MTLMRKARKRRSRTRTKEQQERSRARRRGLAARKTRCGRERRRMERRRTRTRWCSPEIEATHGRRHISRNKFSGYRIYFRCGSATEAAPSPAAVTYAAAGAAIYWPIPTVATGKREQRQTRTGSV